MLTGLVVFEPECEFKFFTHGSEMVHAGLIMFHEIQRAHLGPAYLRWSCLDCVFVQ